jgi:hypothetical protein
VIYSIHSGAIVQKNHALWEMRCKRGKNLEKSVHNTYLNSKSTVHALHHSSQLAHFFHFKNIWSMHSAHYSLILINLITFFDQLLKKILRCHCKMNVQNKKSKHFNLNQHSNKA